jgi:hypothetical protein
MNHSEHNSRLASISSWPQRFAPLTKPLEKQPLEIQMLENPSVAHRTWQAG